MGRLIPERRIDRNGKAVTRHVRAEPRTAAGGTGLPAPTLTGRAATAPTTFRPRPKQLEVRLLSFELQTHERLSEALAGPYDDLKRKLWGRPTFHAEASTVQAYEVISAVARPADAVKLLSEGVRTAEEARAYLAQRGAEHLGADRSAAARRALETNVDPAHYMHWYPICARSQEELRQEDIVDAVRLAATSLRHDPAFHDTLKDVAAGRVGFDDMKAIGITKLKPLDRLKYLCGVFRRIRSGDEGFTVEALSEVLDRAAETGIEKQKPHLLGDLLAHAQTERIARMPSLERLFEAYNGYVFGIGRPQRWDREQSAERAFYHAALGDAAPTGPDFFKSNDFFEAGIPAEIAREALLNGGTVETARDIHELGVSRAVSDGWL